MVHRFIFILCLLFVQAFGNQWQIAIATMFQNEAPWLKEWIEYHKLIGVQHFYLFNNESTDNYTEVLAPYIANGEVELFQVEGISTSQKQHHYRQGRAMRHALRLAKNKVKWLAIIDADEFIVPVEGDQLFPVLERFDKKRIGGVFAHWLAFGTSHVEKIPEDKLLTETLLLCEENISKLGKSIVRPEKVKSCTDPHCMNYLPGFYHVNTDFKKFRWKAPLSDKEILIYHYYTRDLDHLIHVKYPRRRVWGGIELENYIANMEGLNKRQNLAMLRFAEELAKRVGLIN